MPLIIAQRGLPLPIIHTRLMGSGAILTHLCRSLLESEWTIRTPTDKMTASDSHLFDCHHVILHASRLNTISLFLSTFEIHTLIPLCSNGAWPSSGGVPKKRRIRYPLTTFSHGRPLRGDVGDGDNSVRFSLTDGSLIMSGLCRQAGPSASCANRPACPKMRIGQLFNATVPHCN